jgi:hypothetical protein
MMARKNQTHEQVEVRRLWVNPDGTLALQMRIDRRKRKIDYEIAYEDREGIEDLEEYGPWRTVPLDIRTTPRDLAVETISLMMEDLDNDRLAFLNDEEASTNAIRRVAQEAQRLIEVPPPQVRHPAIAALASMLAATRMVRVSLEANDEEPSPELSALCTDVAERVMGYLFGDDAVGQAFRQAVGRA